LGSFEAQKLSRSLPCELQTRKPVNRLSLEATCKELAHTFAEALVRALREAPLSELEDILGPSSTHPVPRLAAPAQPKPGRVPRATAKRGGKKDEARVSAVATKETRPGASLANLRGAVAEPRKPSREPRPKQKAPVTAEPEREVSAVAPGEPGRDVAPPALAPAPEQAWTVNVGDGDQREMAVKEIVLAYASGQVTDDTFVWKIGMPEWVPLRELSAIFKRAMAKAKS
jgi:hypothetical protein